jgi:beta-lactamase class A
MSHSRREFLKNAAASATLAATPLTLATAAAAGTTNSVQTASPNQIAALFQNLPGQVAFKVFVPPANGRPGFRASSNSNKMLFVASAIKTYVLCEAMRQADAPNIDEVLQDKRLPLNSTIWSFGSPSFTPEDLIGTVSERTTMEAMITRSDNTATDMMFKFAGANNVRSFISSIGLTNTLVPDSTRALTAYIFGAPNYLTISWEDLQDYVNAGNRVHPFLNDVETLASSADDFVSYYSRALQGKFFQHAATLNEFRRILTLCDFIYLIPVPLGVSAYAKSGNADIPGFHARSFAGGMFANDRWSYFAFIINWDSEAPEDPQTVHQFFAAINQTLTLIKDL